MVHKVYWVLSVVAASPFCLKNGYQIFCEFLVSFLKQCQHCTDIEEGFIKISKV